MKIYGVSTCNSTVNQQPKRETTFGLIRENNPDYRQTKKILKNICGPNGDSGFYFDTFKNNKGITFYPSNGAIKGELNRDYVNSSAGGHWYNWIEKEGMLKSIDSHHKLQNIIVTLMDADGEELIDAEKKRPKGGDPPILREKYWREQSGEIIAKLAQFGIGTKKGLLGTPQNLLELTSYKNTEGMRLYVEKNKLKCVSELQYRSLNWLQYPEYVKKAQEVEKYLKDRKNNIGNKTELNKAKSMFKEAVKTFKAETPKPKNDDNWTDSIAIDRG